MATKFEIVLDCANPDRQADFWCAALAYEKFGQAANYRSLIDPDGILPKLILQGVDEPKTVKNRVHIDIHHEDIEAAAERLTTLGATRLHEEAMQEHGTAWILMADPEGNEFCVCQL